MLPRIIVCYHSFGTCPTQFAEDLARGLRYSGTIIPKVIHEQSCYVDSARNNLVKRFLAEADATHMMMVDVDISFETDAFLKTFTIMSAVHADLLYGNYSLGNGANSIFGPPENAAKEAAVRVNLEANKLYTDIATGGTGWLMVTKELLQRMDRECEGPWKWFARDPTADGKDRRGEDISFGLRAWGLNPRPNIVGTTAILLRHLKNQGFYPEHMMRTAANSQGSGICIPNPFEVDKERYVALGNAVIDLSQLVPDQKEKVLAEVAAYKAAQEAALAASLPPPIVLPLEKKEEAV